MVASYSTCVSQVPARTRGGPLPYVATAILAPSAAVQNRMSGRAARIPARPAGDGHSCVILVRPSGLRYYACDMAAPRLATKAQRLTLRSDGSLRLAVVADTHSQPHPRTTEHLTARAPDAILHAGDIGDLDVLAQLSRIAPVHAIRGNIDVRAADLPDVLTLDLVRIVDDQQPLLRLLLIHIGVYGPKLRAEVATMARTQNAQLVICGHSHVPFLGRDRGVTVFNPGSIGPRRFHLPFVFGTIDVTPTGLRLAHIDCETGAPWTPS